ncbi:MAG: hypothetical protein RL624_88 [Bacteroidota bacterium]
MRILILSMIFILLTSYTFAQSLIVGIPSADVAEKHHLEITHETQWNFWGQTSKWNSFNFACFGLGNGLEITSTLNNLDNKGSQNLAFGLGAKKVINLFETSDPYEHKLVIGGNALYSTTKKNIGVWTYALYSFRIPKLKTRFTSGFSYGNSQTFGFTTFYENDKLITTPNNKTVLLIGLEQPLAKNISFICDWYSGTHDLASFIPAMQFDFNHSVFIVGYKFPNNADVSDRAIIVEYMFSIPTRK